MRLRETADHSFSETLTVLLPFALLLKILLSSQRQTSLRYAASKERSSKSSHFLR
jgi:hypothetical protein